MLHSLQCRCIIQALLQKVKTAEKSLQEFRSSISMKANKIIIQWISAPPALGTGHSGTAVAVERYHLRAQSLPFFIDWHRWRKEVKIKWWKRQVPKKWRHDNQKWQKIITPYGSLSPCPLSLSLSLSLSLQRRYSPGWASASFKSFLRPSQFRATIFQFLHPSLATSSSTPSSQRNVGLPLGRFPPGSLRRTLLDKSSSSWRMTCPALVSMSKVLFVYRQVHFVRVFAWRYCAITIWHNWATQAL